MYRNIRRTRAKHISRLFFQFMVLNIKICTITDYAEYIIVNAQYMFKK